MLVGLKSSLIYSFHHKENPELRSHSHACTIISIDKAVFSPPEAMDGLPKHFQGQLIVFSISSTNSFQTWEIAFTALNCYISNGDTDRMWYTLTQCPDPSSKSRKSSARGGSERPAWCQTWKLDPQPSFFFIFHAFHLFPMGDLTRGIMALNNIGPRNVQEMSSCRLNQFQDHRNGTLTLCIWTVLRQIICNAIRRTDAIDDNPRSDNM